MIEIVFSDSAGGLLKHAQHYGEGPYNDEGHPVMLYYGAKKSSGEAPSQEEIDAIRKAFHEKKRRAWESAIPLGGKSSDVYDFELGLSMGNLDEEEFSVDRLRHIRDTVKHGAGNGEDFYYQKKYERYRDMAEHAMERIAAGEPVRIWYSNHADEYCGLLWFCHKMRQAGVPLDKVYTVSLPDWYYNEASETVETFADWGGVDPAYVGHLAKSTQLMPVQLVMKCAADWQELCLENAPLRATIGGKVVSVPEDFYDHLLWKQVERLSEEKGVFGAGPLIGGVLEHQIGVWDSWLAYRVKSFREQGLLEIVEEAEDGWIYQTKLRKKCSK